MITTLIEKTEAVLIQVHGTKKISVLNYMELLLKVLLPRLEHTDTISCVL